MEGEGNGVFGLLQRQDQHLLISSRASGSQTYASPEVVDEQLKSLPSRVRRQAHRRTQQRPILSVSELTDDGVNGRVEVLLSDDGVGADAAHAFRSGRDLGRHPMEMEGTGGERGELKEAEVEGGGEVRIKLEWGA